MALSFGMHVKVRFALKHFGHGYSPDVWIFEPLRAHQKRASTRTSEWKIIEYVCRAKIEDIKLKGAGTITVSSKRIQKNNLSFLTRTLLAASIGAISVANHLLFVFFLRGIFGNTSRFRIILQLHHVHGGKQRRADRSGAQLSSQIARQIRDAKLGKKIYTIDCN